MMDDFEFLGRPRVRPTKAKGKWRLVGEGVMGEGWGKPDETQLPVYVYRRSDPNIRTVLSPLFRYENTDLWMPVSEFEIRNVVTSPIVPPSRPVSLDGALYRVGEWGDIERLDPRKGWIQYLPTHHLQHLTKLMNCLKRDLEERLVEVGEVSEWNEGLVENVEEATDLDHIDETQDTEGDTP
jgi:hypothetical protein